MKTSLMLLTVFIVVLLSISLALANPALLPKHPGAGHESVNGVPV
jgi:hypothetical protein